MLNRSSIWTYLILIIIVIFGFLYAFPNLYGEDPAIRINSIDKKKIDQLIPTKIQDLLKKNKIFSKSITLKNNIIFISFYTSDDQMLAHDILMNIFKKDYIITLDLVPNFPNWLYEINAKPIKLGLDLRGGVHFLIKVDMEIAINDFQKKIFDILYEDLYKENINFSVKKNEINNIKLFFADKITRNKAILRLSSPQYNEITTKILEKNTLCISLSNNKIQQIKRNTMQKNLEILRNRVNQLGVSEPIVQRQGNNNIIVELPGVLNIEQAKEILGTTATLEFHLVNTSIDSSNILNYSIPYNSEIKTTSDGKPIIIYKDIILNGSHIIDAIPYVDEYNQSQVSIFLDNAGGKIMADFSEKNIGKIIAALFVEYKKSESLNKENNSSFEKKDVVINVAVIQTKLGNSFRITGIRNHEESKRLALLLRAGTLTTPIKIIEESTIGPTLGIQNIKKGFNASICGIVISILFMIIRYKKFGLIASAAIIVNLMLIISIMSQLPGAILTMPGIAGIILTLAIAVDANVLINERIKEELRNGTTIQKSISKGYTYSYSSIIDANITTLIVVTILYTICTGPIKGFALTTIIGIITSVFTAIIGTRAIVNFLYGNKNIKKLSI